MVEFGIDVQSAVEAPNMNSYQIQSSFGAHNSEPGRLILRDDTPKATQQELQKMGYRIELRKRTSEPTSAILFDEKQRGFQGAASDFGEDYGIAW